MAKTRVQRIFKIPLNLRWTLAVAGIFVTGCLYAQPPANKPVVGAGVPAPSQSVAATPSGYIVSGGNPVINYVREREALCRITDENAFATAPYTSVTQSTRYVDGLGRHLQTVHQQYSPGATPQDLVEPVFYDPLGRETYNYLPYTETTGSSTVDGKFKLNPFADQAGFFQGAYVADQPSLTGEQVYYNQTIFESSPLNRVLAKMGPGNSWAGSGRGAHFQYLYSSSTDAVPFWTITNNPLTYDNNGNADPNTNTNIPSSSATYGAGQLIKTVVTDEQGNATVLYYDKDEHLILRKIQQGSVSADYSGFNNWICTFYVYDDLGQVRFVISPKATAALVSAGNWNLAANTTTINELCFRYEYDDRGRMIAKKKPGAGWEYLIYDARDRIVFTQDAHQRQNNQWLTTLYDGLDRAVMTGIMSNGTTIQAGSLQSYATAASSPAAAGISSNITLSSASTGTYQATNSITMNPGFSATGTSGTFVAQIVPAGGTTGPTVVINGIAVNNDPIPGGYGFIPLTKLHYDDYSWTSKAYTAAYNNSVNAGSDPYPETLPSQASVHTRGQQTGTEVRTMENPSDLTQGNTLTTVDFFNNRGMLIQEQADNYRGGTDIATNLYDFSGKLLSKYKVYNNPSAGAAGNIHVLTYTNYDVTGRPLQEYETINDNPATTRLLAQFSYDHLGTPYQKKLGQTTSGTFLETQDFTYNIRGWLQGINRDYSNNDNSRGADNRWFGLELDYDWGFGTNQYTGNVAGTRWRSKGDGQQRAYGYTYDPLKRLMSADFSQFDGSAGSYADNSVVNFDVVLGNGTDPNSAYDANGNIIAMKQWGIKNNANKLIDDLTYNYIPGTNKLQNIMDGQDDATTQLGDFRTSALSPNHNGKTISSVDYYYDANGNLTRDLNKDIGTQSVDGITYNYLNQPYQVTVQGASGAKGTITYIYDAKGHKMRKTVVDNATQTQTTTIYLDDLVYQDRLPVGASSVDTLQFMMTQEGRVRPVANAPSTQMINAFNYDYFIKDNLNNTRMILTDQQQQDIYPAVTLENNNTPTTDPVTVEEQYYTINTAQIVSSPAGIPIYQDNNGNPPVNNNPNCSNTSVIKQTDNSQKVYQMNAASTSKTGLGITLKVMSGDRLDIFGLSYYSQINTGGQPANLAMAATDIINGLLSSPGSPANPHITASQMSSNTVGDITPLSSFINNHDNPGAETTPRAYINYVFFDDQFNVAGYGASQVGQANTLTDHYRVNQQLNNITAPKNGYVYVFCSNESPVNVFFDNLQVILTHGPLVEETHYYPFGLTMAGISDKAMIANYSENKYRFNGGNELQNKEFSDGSGLELYDAQFRSYDPQIGRFWQIDPLADLDQEYSPFAFAEDDPVSFNDPDGLVVPAPPKDPTMLPTVFVIAHIKRLPTVTVTAKLPERKNLDKAQTPQRAQTTSEPKPPSASVPWMNKLIADAQRLGGADETEDPTYTLASDALDFVGADDDNPHHTAWCSALMCFEVNSTNHDQPKSAASRDWLSSHRVHKVDKPYYGAIMVFKYYKDKELTKPMTSGHISSYYGYNKASGRMIGLGGNQSDGLRFSGYKVTSDYIKDAGGYLHFEGFYMPNDYNGPLVEAPNVPPAAVLNEKFGIKPPKKKGNSTK